MEPERRAVELLGRAQSKQSSKLQATATATRFVTCQSAAAKCSARADTCRAMPTSAYRLRYHDAYPGLRRSPLLCCCCCYLPAPASQHPVPMAVSHDCSLTLAPCSPACCCR
jgi:hypothetical protein